MNAFGKITSDVGAGSLLEHFDRGPAADTSASDETANIPGSTGLSLALSALQLSSSETTAAARQSPQHVSAANGLAVQAFDSVCGADDVAAASTPNAAQPDTSSSALHSSSAVSAPSFFPQAAVAKTTSIIPVTSTQMHRSNPAVEQHAVQVTAHPTLVRHRHRNALHLATTAGSVVDVQHLLIAHPEYLHDVDFEGHTPLSLSLQLMNSAAGSMLRRVGLCHHRHIELNHNKDSFRGETLESNFQVCKLIGKKVRNQKDLALSMEYASRYRRSVAAACFNDISLVLSNNMNSFQESQWRSEQRNLALCLASAFKNQRFRRHCSKLARERHLSRAQTLIACAYRVRYAKLALLFKRSVLKSRAASRISHLYFLHTIYRRMRARAALIIQRAWLLRKPHQAVRDLRRVLYERKGLLRANKVLTLVFKFFAARLAFARAQAQLLYHRKLIAIAQENEMTGSFAVRLQIVMRCARARKVYSLAFRQHNAVKIQCFYRSHIARCRAASDSADESALIAFKSGYRFSIFGVSGFVPKIRINLGGLATRCIQKLQRVWRGHSARLLISRLALQRAHACARTVQSRYARHYHFDW
jgi:hypothetical protein